jgi:multidrug efflux pump subunit AcrA (membrane-fusion protein)
LGQEVHFSSPDIEGDWTGTISRIAPVVDAATQSIQVIIALSGDRLREGMYLTGTIDGLQVKNALKIPASMVFDNEFVYTIIQDSVLDKTAVDVVEWLEDEIIIKGLESGAVMVNEPTLKAAAGLVVEPIK